MSMPDVAALIALWTVAVTDVRFDPLGPRSPWMVGSDGETLLTPILSPRYLTIVVGDPLVAEGCRGNCLGCPVALALLYATGEVWHVNEVFARREDTPGRYNLWKFPLEVAHWIKGFDNEWPVGATWGRPRTLTLRLPRRFLYQKEHQNGT